MNRKKPLQQRCFVVRDTYVYSVQDSATVSWGCLCDFEILFPSVKYVLQDIRGSIQLWVGDIDSYCLRIFFESVLYLGAMMSLLVIKFQRDDLIYQTLVLHHRQ